MAKVWAAGYLATVYFPADSVIKITLDQSGRSNTVYEVGSKSPPTQVYGNLSRTDMGRTNEEKSASKGYISGNFGIQWKIPNLNRFRRWYQRAKQNTPK